MDIETLFGLPAHPLLVHVPVVLIPLCAIGAIGVFWKPWRERLGWATVILLGVSGIFTQLAIGSGQALEEATNEHDPLVRAHTSIAENIRPFLLLFFVFLVAFMLVVRKREQAGESASLRRPALAILFALTMIFAGVSVYWVQRIGHTGARSAWHNKVDADGRLRGVEGGEGGN
jgi:uncharacterized membrane protein